MMLFYAALHRANEMEKGEGDEIVAQLGYASEILKHSLELFDQNTDKSISLEAIHQDIGTIFGYMGKKEEAVAYLKAHNTGNMNDKMIAVFLCEMGEYERAWEYASKTFRKNLLELWSSHFAIYNILINTKRYAELLMLAEWMKNVCKEAAAEESSYFIRAAAMTEALIATVYAHKQVAEGVDYGLKVREYLQNALLEAKRFDEHPDYSGKLRLFHYEAENVHDGFGGSGLEAVRHVIICSREDEVKTYFFRRKQNFMVNIYHFFNDGWWT